MSNYVPNINIILESNKVVTSRGAPMGAAQQMDDLTRPLLVQGIVMVDGDYAPDGTYWGGAGYPLWCAFNPDTDEFKAGMGTRIYVRARDFEHAVSEAREEAPSAAFASRQDSEPTEDFEVDDGIDDEADGGGCGRDCSRCGCASKGPAN